jgi:hypothetical protein
MDAGGEDEVNALVAYEYACVKRDNEKHDSECLLYDVCIWLKGGSLWRLWLPLMRRGTRRGSFIGVPC